MVMIVRGQHCKETCIAPIVLRACSASDSSSSICCLSAEVSACCEWQMITRKYSPSKDMNLALEHKGAANTPRPVKTSTVRKLSVRNAWVPAARPAMRAVLTFIAWMHGLGRCYLDLDWNILPDKKLLPRWYAAIRGLEVALVMKRWQSNPTLRPTLRKTRVFWKPLRVLSAQGGSHPSFGWARPLHQLLGPNACFLELQNLTEIKQ